MPILGVNYIKRIKLKNINNIMKHHIFIKKFALVLGIFLAIKTPYGSNKPEISTKETLKIAKMQAYIDKLYKGIVVVHQFIENGNEVTCVDITTQPSLKGTIGTIAKPPTTPLNAEMNTEPLNGKKPIVLSKGYDQYGRKMSCPENSIPMLLITLDKMKRFGSVEKFLNKYPGKTEPSALQQKNF